MNTHTNMRRGINLLNWQVFGMTKENGWFVDDFLTQLLDPNSAYALAGVWVGSMCR